MYILKITLRQHTPIIHFQHDQEGATLRASEVKPKLDRFLITKLKLTTFEIRNNQRIEVPKSEYSTWFKNENTFSLDYTLKFTKSNLIWENQVTIIPPNIDTAIKKEDFDAIMGSAYDDLLSKIDENIIEFFVLNNFGKRQSKGFGCFYVHNTSIVSFQNLNCLVFRYDRPDFRNEGINFYEIIAKSWRNLKSGSNRPYKKSRLFKYMYANSMRWDKRYFKVELYDWINNPDNLESEFKHDLLITNYEPLDVSDYEEGNNQAEGYYSYEDNEDYEDFYYFGRAFLGLAEHYEFRTIRKDRIYQFKVKSETIDRFKSPVTFKIFDNQIFAIVESLPDEILDNEFSFDLIVKNPSTRATLIVKENFTTLSTPPEFSLNEFLSNHFSYVGFRQL